jgi:hypothetical protein
MMNPLGTGLLSSGVKQPGREATHYLVSRLRIPETNFHSPKVSMARC